MSDTTTIVEATDIKPSVDDQVKLATAARDDRRLAHQIRVEEHNMQNAKLQWLHRGLFEPSGPMGGVPFVGDQRQALINRYGKLLLKFTKPSGEEEAIWPTEEA